MSLFAPWRSRYCGLKVPSSPRSFKVRALPETPVNSQDPVSHYILPAQAAAGNRDCPEGDLGGRINYKASCSHCPSLFGFCLACSSICIMSWNNNCRAGEQVSVPRVLRGSRGWPWRNRPRGPELQPSVPPLWCILPATCEMVAQS